MRRLKVHLLTSALLGVVFLLPVACSKSGRIAVGAAPSRPDERRYAIEGTVVAVNKSRHEITLNHKAIPGFMSAMTMPYPVRQDWVFATAQPGDELHGSLVVGSGETYLEAISLNKSTTMVSESSTSQIHTPSVGDKVPDFSFVDQSGHRVRLSRFRGKQLLLTFVYTRCPLPDFCIRMSENFAQLAGDLKQAEPQTYRKFQLLSISIDPEYDKPAVLKDYGKRYAGKVDPDFQHWRFVSGTPAETRKAADFFGLSYFRTAGQNWQIVHSLRTVLISPNGKIAALYFGNDWKPSEVEAELKK